MRRYRLARGVPGFQAGVVELAAEADALGAHGRLQVAAHPQPNLRRSGQCPTLLQAALVIDEPLGEVRGSGNRKRLPAVVAGLCEIRCRSFQLQTPRPLPIRRREALVIKGHRPPQPWIARHLRPIFLPVKLMLPRLIGGADGGPVASAQALRRFSSGGRAE